MENIIGLYPMDLGSYPNVGFKREIEWSYKPFESAVSASLSFISWRTRSKMRYKSKETENLAIEKLEIGRNLILEKNQKIKNEYELNPKKCLFCEKEISYEKRENSFCNHSCSASYNNPKSKRIYKSEDLSNMIFANWKALRKDKKGKRGQQFYLCLCICGNERVVSGNSLKSGKSKSCGCLRKKLCDSGKRKINDLTGKTFGNLYVVKRVESIKGQSVFLCECKCGNTKEIRGRSLLRKDTVSCGCLSESRVASELKQYFKLRYNAIPEYKTIKNPETNQWLKCDIYIPHGSNSKLNGFYIEIHGEQHYILSRWHFLQSRNNKTTPEEEFEYQKYKDKMKKKFAKKHGYYIEIDLRKINSPNDAINKIKAYLEEKW